MLPTTALAAVPVAVWIFCLIALATGRLLFFRYKKGFSKYNGPFLGSFTDLWKAYHNYFNMDKPPMVDVHEKYGDVVRVGPNFLSFAKPEAIKDIYGPGKPWNKSGFYPVQAVVVKGESATNLLSSGDIPWHNTLRKAINPFFTATAVMDYEHLIAKTIDCFLEQWDNRFSDKRGPDGVIDLADWLQYFAFDVTGELTYGSRHGFMELGSDSQGIIAFLDRFAVYGAVAGAWPVLDKVLRQNPILLWLQRQGLYQASTFSLGMFVGKRMRDRIVSYKTGKDLETKEGEDLLDKFLKAKETHPDIMSEREVVSTSITMIGAGAETMLDPLPLTSMPTSVPIIATVKSANVFAAYSAVTLTAFFYFILKSPVYYDKLQHELDTQLPARDLSSLKCDVQFSQAQKLPYLRACIQETFRMHPASAMQLERVVPPAGANIAGEQIPGGTVVGVSTWATHRNTEVFGEDAKTFRPERWLEASEERVRLMEKTMLHFGAGNHVCLGKSIAVMEIYKVIPNLLRTFKLELMNPEKDWTLVTALIVRQEDVKVRIKRRTG